MKDLGADLPLAEKGIAQLRQLSSHRCILTSMGHSRPQDPNHYDWDNNIRGGGCLFQYTLSGEGRFRDGNTGVTTRLVPGTGFLVPFPSNTYYWLEPDLEWEFLFACMTGDTLLHHVHNLNRDYGHVFKPSPNSEPIRILCRLFRAVAAGSPPGDYSISGALYQFLMGLYELSQPAAESIPDPIRRARDHIDSNYHQIDVGVDTLARLAGYSKYHFSRKFKAAVGVSPYEYLLQVRLQRAQELVTTTDLPLKEIGRAVGFGDYAYFCNSFRRRIGMPPGQLRRQSQRFRLATS